MVNERREEWTERKRKRDDKEMYVRTRVTAPPRECLKNPTMVVLLVLVHHLPVNANADTRASVASYFSPLPNWTVSVSRPCNQLRKQHTSTLSEWDDSCKAGVHG